VPRTLKPIVMSKLDTEFKDQIENYISPSKSITYMLHSQHIANMKITITVSIFKELPFFISFEENKNTKKFLALKI